MPFEILLVPILWVVIGIYASCMNAERVRRLYPKTLSAFADSAQDSLTAFLGPFGLLLVLAHGGRWFFWRK